MFSVPGVVREVALPDQVGGQGAVAKGLFVQCFHNQHHRHETVAAVRGHECVRGPVSPRRVNACECMAGYRMLTANHLRNQHIRIHCIAHHPTYVNVQENHAVATAGRLHPQRKVSVRCNFLNHNIFRVRSYRHRGSAHRYRNMRIALILAGLQRLVKAPSYRVKLLINWQYRQVVVGYRIHRKTIHQLCPVVLVHPRYRTHREHRVQRRKVVVLLQRTEGIAVTDILSYRQQQNDDAVTTLNSMKRVFKFI